MSFVEAPDAGCHITVRYRKGKDSEFVPHFTIAAGKSDPYVVVCYDNQRDKSKHFKNTLTPEFQFQTGFVTGRSAFFLLLKSAFKNYNTYLQFMKPVVLF